MTFQWEFYLNAAKAQGSYLSELQWLRERMRQVKRERDSLKAIVNRSHELYTEGWSFGPCKCGFSIITLPGGKHYCPKCKKD